MIIYKTTNLINGKVYVGQDIHNNANYLGSGLLLIRAIKKYGRENFKKEVIDVAESLEALNEKEIYWVKFCNCKAPNGYNLNDGGEGVIGYIFTEDDRKKISEALKGKLSWNKGKKVGPHSEGHKKRISEAIKGKKIGSPSKETREKMSEAKKGKHRSKETKEKISETLMGHEVSEETREKMSEAKRGKSLSKETREKMSEVKKGKPLSDGMIKRRLGKKRGPYKKSEKFCL